MSDPQSPTPESTPPSDSRREVTNELATRLLHLGMDEETPVDHLLTFLTLPDSAQWWQEALSNPPIRDGERFRVGPCPPSELNDLKDRSKSQLSCAGNNRDEATAILGYLLAQAAHIIHHGSPLSAQLPSEAKQALADLAVVAPSPWDAFFRDAHSLL